jgi:hypothetical protein
VSFTLQLPSGYFSNVSLNTGGRFTNATFTQGPNSQWFAVLQTSPANPLVGDETIGTLCFTPVSAESAFVSLTVTDVVVTSVDGSVPSVTGTASRVVVIAEKPLLEAWLGTNAQRMVTTYGKTNTAYVIHQSTNVAADRPWPLGWTNTVPASMFTSSPVLGPLSNSPVLFLDAREQ